VWRWRREALTASQVVSTFWRQAGILVRFHSVLRESLRFGDISVPGSDRMDNLLKVHSQPFGEVRQ
jgi:hypothetical protein